MNRRRIAIGVSSVSGLAVIAVSAMNMFSSGGAAGGRGHSTVDLHTTPVAAVTAAGPATDRAGTAQVDSLLTMATPATPAQGKTPAQPAQTATMHGTGQYDFGRQTGKIDLTLANGGLEEVLTPGVLYMRSVPSNAATPAKPWSRVDAAKSSDGNLVSGGVTDPALEFAMLAGVQPGVKFVGQDQVRGVPVAHYQGTLDLKQAASTPTPAGAPAAAPARPAGQALPAAPAAQAVPAADVAAAKKALANAARAFTTTKVPFDAYLDEQGRLRRFVAVFSFTMPGPAKAVAQVTSATELFGFGTPVTVATPTVAPAAPTPSARPSSPSGTHK
ncbi:hypothetical protein [Catenulispora subtropica]|uniref:Lipoprotein n=1 Tax=Catenulispora subtropica TaxID=450798 RepID=A0ABN2RP43_9ACTN